MSESTFAANNLDLGEASMLKQPSEPREHFHLFHVIQEFPVRSLFVTLVAGSLTYSSGSALSTALQKSFSSSIFSAWVIVVLTWVLTFLVLFCLFVLFRILDQYMGPPTPASSSPSPSPSPDPSPYPARFPTRFPHGEIANPSEERPARSSLQVLDELSLTNSGDEM